MKLPAFTLLLCISYSAVLASRLEAQGGPATVYNFPLAQLTLRPSGSVLDAGCRRGKPGRVKFSRRGVKFTALARGDSFYRTGVRTCREESFTYIDAVNDSRVGAMGTYVVATILATMKPVLDAYQEVYAATGAIDTVTLNQDGLAALAAASSNATTFADYFFALNAENVTRSETITAPNCNFSVMGAATGGPGYSFRCDTIIGVDVSMSDVTASLYYQEGKLKFEMTFLNLISGASDLNGSFNGTIALDSTGLELSGRGEFVSDKYAANFKTGQLHRSADGGCLFDGGKLSVNPSFPSITALFDAETPNDRTVTIKTYGAYEHTLAECGNG